MAYHILNFPKIVRLELSTLDLVVDRSPIDVEQEESPPLRQKNVWQSVCLWRYVES